MVGPNGRRTESGDRRAGNRDGYASVMVAYSETVLSRFYDFARIARRSRGHSTLHLPEAWHREHHCTKHLSSHLRPADRSGLTGPDQVTAPPHGQMATQTQPGEPWK